MGSSTKKHKDRKRKKRDRTDKSMSPVTVPREKERHHRKHKRDKQKKRSSESDERSNSAKITIIEIEDDDIVPPPPPNISRISETSSPILAQCGSKTVQSLSINDANRIRAKLGLKPLQQVPPAPPAPKISKGGVVEDLPEEYDTSKPIDFVHKPATNISQLEKTRKLKEKLQLRRDKRHLESKLLLVKPLTANSDSEDDVESWVNKSRRIEQEKRKAQHRAKMLEELDAEFGVGELVDSEIEKHKHHSYTSSDLRGIQVEHDTEKFVEGKQMILTLKDQGVLEGGDDVLVNVNMKDDEHYNKNNLLKKMRPDMCGYNVFENEEFDESGNYVEKTVLKKYDDEIEGEKKTSFILGQTTEEVAASKQNQLLAIRNKLQKKVVETLASSGPQLATDYYTSAEMVKFKKTTKRMRKVRKQKPLTANDLMSDIQSTQDFASRKQRHYKRKYGSSSSNTARMSIEAEDDFFMDDGLPTGEDYTDIKLEPDDNMDLELQAALSKTRKLRDKLEHRVLGEVPPPPPNISIYRGDTPDNEIDDIKSSITLNATAEFCRSLGDIPTYGQAGNRQEEDEVMDFERDEMSDEKYRMDDIHGRGAWNEVEIINDAPAEVDIDDMPILDKEPDVGTGLAGALKLALSKGYLEIESKKNISKARMKHLEAQHYSIEDKSHLEDDKFSRREHYTAGPSSEFREKSSYKPDVKLEYIDDDGRLLSAKEAFRYLSHKFHGKGPGKNKVEKRQKKREQDMLMQCMSSTDTPLGTLNLLQHKQKETQSPFIILTGNKSLQSISKPSSASRKN